MIQSHISNEQGRDSRVVGGFHPQYLDKKWKNIEKEYTFMIN